MDMTPIYPVDFFFDAIINGTTPPDPICRMDYYLAKIAGADVEIPMPIYRIEYYLAKLCGEDVETPDPIDRMDFYLDEWIKATQLPAEYTRQKGFTYNNNAYFKITGFKLKGSDTVRISFSVLTGCNVFGCYQGTEQSDNYDLYVSVSPGAKYLRYGDGTYLSYWSAENLGSRFDVVFAPTGTHGMPEDSTWTEKSFTSANDLLIGATTTTGTSSKLVGNIYGDIIVDGRLILVPCKRNSDSELGYYDTIGQTFYEQTGSGLVSLGNA